MSISQLGYFRGTNVGEQTAYLVLQESIRDVGTIRENSELVGPAEGAFAADVHVNGCKAEVVASVILLSFGQV